MFCCFLRTFTPRSFVKPHLRCFPLLLSYFLLISGRSLQALERPAILVQAQIASLSTLV